MPDLLNREIEVKFLEIDKPKLIEKLIGLGASDLGEEKITEQIFHDLKGEWVKQQKFARIRTTGKGVYFTYKHSESRTAEGTIELEFKIDNPETLKSFLEVMGLGMDREQEKIRHKFKLDGVIIDIDTWPKVPTYVELEGPDVESIKNASVKLGLDYSKGVFGTASYVIEEVYHISVNKLRYFTFSRVG